MLASTAAIHQMPAGAGGNQIAKYRFASPKVTSHHFVIILSHATRNNGVGQSGNKQGMAAVLVIKALNLTRGNRMGAVALLSPHVHARDCNARHSLRDLRYRRRLGPSAFFTVRKRS